MNAIILAGGRGSRLQPWHAPKCLLPINGVPMLHRILLHLEEAAIRTAIVCTGYRADDVEASLTRFEADMNIGVSDAGEDAPMGARLLKARNADSVVRRVLICYGDELADVNISALLLAHEGALMTFTFARAASPGGTVDTDGEQLIVENQTHFANIGFVVVEPECWDVLEPEDGLSDWINRVWANARKQVHMFVHEGKRATVNSLADLQYAEEVWK